MNETKQKLNFGLVVCLLLCLVTVFLPKTHTKKKCFDNPIPETWRVNLGNILLLLKSSKIENLLDIVHRKGLYDIMYGNMDGLGNGSKQDQAEMYHF